MEKEQVIRELKKWDEPKIIKLQVNETKSGTANTDIEAAFVNPNGSGTAS